MEQPEIFRDVRSLFEVDIRYLSLTFTITFTLSVDQIRWQ
jgi:hypothetical protein